MTFTNSISTCFRKFAKFQGRASRSEFWYYHLFLIIFIGSYSFVVINMTDILIRSNIEISSINPIVIYVLQILPALILFLLIFPLFSVTVRRLHDVNKSGWFQLLYLTPSITNLIPKISPLIVFISALIGMIPVLYLLFLYCKKGDLKGNDYGPNIY